MTKRIRHVHDSRMVAHLWADRSQDSARTPSNNFHFDGRDIHSYFTRVAAIADTPNGGKAFLLTSDRYSVTTSGHMRDIQAAIHGRDEPHFRVPLGQYSVDHAKSVAHLLAQYNDAKARALRAVKLPRQTRACELAPNYGLTSAATELTSYCRTFGLEAPAIALEADLRAVTEHFARIEARDNDPKEIAKRESAKAAREARADAKSAREREAAERERLLWRERTLARWVAWELDSTMACPTVSDFHDFMWKGALDVRETTAIRTRIHEASATAEALDRQERLAAWLGGEAAHFSARMPDGTCYLRINGAVLETSQGARVPLSHAARMWPFIRKCKADAVRWDITGKTIRVGSFVVNYIDADGLLKAGCHRISHAESARIAAVLGISDATSNEIQLQFPLASEEETEAA